MWGYAMNRAIISAVFVICAAATTLAQPPRKLPPTVDEPPPARPPGPLSPAEAAKQRENAIKSLREDIVSFEPTEVVATQIEGRWKVHTRSVLLKDFGTDRAAAQEAVRTIQDLRVNQLGTVPGAQPPFEYWLTDGRAPRGLNARVLVVPISARTIRAESVGGTWVVTDSVRGLYDFGPDAEAAKKAAIIFWKYGFNQIGVIGSPRPAMFYPLQDPRQATVDRAAPNPDPSPLGVLNDVSRTSLLLPGNTYAGAKSPIDAKKLETSRAKSGEWTLTHAGDVLARFGGSETSARTALKALQDARPTEIVWIGEARVPLFLAEGQPLRYEPLGGGKTAFRADRLKIQELRKSWWLFDDSRPLMEVGAKSDAELLLRVLRAYDLRAMYVYGRPESGGLRLFTVGR
jgi:hypothetical protein